MNHRNTYGRLTYGKDAKRYDTPEEKQIKAVMPPMGIEKGPRAEVAQATVSAVGGAAGAAGMGAALPGAGALLQAAPPVAAASAAAIGVGGIGLAAGALATAGHNAHMTILEGPKLDTQFDPTSEQLDQAYEATRAQNLAQSQVKPVSWVRLSVAHPCAALAYPPPIGAYGGGSYACIKKRQSIKRNNLRNTPHHTPSASSSYLPYSAGPVVEMFLIDYTLTESYQNNSKSIKCIALQSALIRSGNFSGATAIDVADIKNKFSDGRYGAAIGQMLAYTACLKQNGYIR
ncbi:hypothetical protein [Methylobacterium ajmalii]|nr:hypothetical protein [Methylobacterium ajmalii]MBK3397949.1 hypothetical protein [Methylobacterium ajmalii]MBK3422821.1 hypothetical protein [Methylobacterium ajmalii]MBZ6417157.1 hypothetical protein [Methylobacterium sp.]